MVERTATSPKKVLNEIEQAELVTVFASAIALGVAKRHPGGPGGPPLEKLTNHVSRQSPNSRRRKRTAQGPGRVQASARREVWAAILYHELRWQGCTSLSLRGVGADRAEAGRAL